jgi:hypothetical protein
VSGDAVLVDLLRELEGYPAPKGEAVSEDAIAVPFRIHTQFGLLSFFSMTAVFGTPVDVTLKMRRPPTYSTT